MAFVQSSSHSNRDSNRDSNRNSNRDGARSNSDRNGNMAAYAGVVTSTTGPRERERNGGARERWKDGANRASRADLSAGADGDISGSRDSLNTSKVGPMPMPGLEGDAGSGAAEPDPTVSQLWSPQQRASMPAVMDKPAASPSQPLGHDSIAEGGEAAVDTDKDNPGQESAAIAGATTATTSADAPLGSENNEKKPLKKINNNGYKSRDGLWNINVTGRSFMVPGIVLVNSDIAILANLHPGDDCRYFLPEQSTHTGQLHFYLPRRACVFEAVLMYLHEGGIHMPPGICAAAWHQELKFYGLEDVAPTLQTCNQCHHNMELDTGPNLQRQGSRDTLQDTDGSNNTGGNYGGSMRTGLALSEIADEAMYNSSIRGLRARVWAITDGLGWSARSAYAANVFTVVSSTILLASVCTFCVETLPQYRLKEVQHCPTTNSSVASLNGSTTTTSTHAHTIDAHQRGCYWKEEATSDPALNTLEAVFITWFTVELLVRLYASPGRVAFCKDLLNIVDVVAIAPFYIGLMMQNDSASGLAVFRAIRLVRVFRIFKLGRHSEGMQIFGTALYRSRRELMQLMVFLSIAVILYASAMFYIEHDNDSPEYGRFDSIPASFWWAIVTMTTLGYGDMVPQTELGKLLGSICAVTGILVLSLPIPIFVNNFQDLLQQAERRRNSVAGGQR